MTQLLPEGRDVTELRVKQVEAAQLEERLRQAQKLESVGRLAGGVAHDFDNILTVIRGDAEVLLDGLDDGGEGDPAEQRELLGEIVAAATSAARLTQQLLAFSRKEPVDPRPVDVAAMVTNLRTMLGRLLGDRHSVETALPEHPAMIIADPGQLEQVIVNLAVNARDAMPDGGTLRLEVAEDVLAPDRVDGWPEVVPGPAIRLTVQDFGVGMTDAVRERVFEPFFTTKERGKGTGLGLASAYGVVRQHRGTIEVDSEVGHGTAFHLRFPVAPGAELGSVPASVAAVDPPLPAARVAVVEDRPDVLVATQRILERAGLDVAGYDDPLRAREALLAAPPDVLVTDVAMRGLGGIDLAEAIHEAHPQVRILLVTGYADDPRADRVRSRAPSCVLTKPYSPAALVGRLAELFAAPSAWPEDPGPPQGA